MPLVSIAILVAFVLAIVAVAAYFRYGRRADRVLSLLALIATLFTLILATVQNQQAANDSARSADASERSADASERSTLAALKTLQIEMTPAAVIDCNPGVKGTSDSEEPLTPGARYQIQMSGPTVRITGQSYFTCEIKNFGREPLLAVQVPLEYQFYRIHKPGQVVTLGTKSTTININGIAPQQTYVVWIDNRSFRSFAQVWTPTSMTFVEPSNLQTRIKYVFPRFFKYEVDTLQPVQMPKLHGLPDFSKMP